VPIIHTTILERVFQRKQIHVDRLNSAQSRSQKFASRLWNMAYKYKVYKTSHLYMDTD